MNNMVNDPFANISANNYVDNSKKFLKPLIICIVVICVLVFYIFVSKFIGSNNYEVKPKENLDEIAIALEDYVINNHLSSLDLYGNENLLRVGIANICYGVISCNEVSGSEVADFVKRVFDREVYLQDVACESNDGSLYTYDVTNDKFVLDANHSSHYSTYKNPILMKVHSIKKKGDSYVLVLNKLYFNPNLSEYLTTDPLGINPIYKFEDYDMIDSKGNIVLDTVKVNTDYENSFDRIKNKGTRYEYTFEKKGSRFVLKMYKVIGNMVNRTN